MLIIAVMFSIVTFASLNVAIDLGFALVTVYIEQRLLLVINLHDPFHTLYISPQHALGLIGLLPVH
jgi:hypothetical protein